MIVKKIKFFFIIAVTLLLGGIIAYKYSKKNNQNSSGENQQENNGSSPSISPDKEGNDSEKENNCPYLNEQNLINKRNLCVMSLHDDRWNTKEDLVKWRQIPQDYIIKLWKKGYHWHEILQLWGWNLPEKDIPDLKNEKEIGVINTLAYLLGIPCSIIEKWKTMPEEEKEIWRKKIENEELGTSTKTIFIVRKSSNPKINFDTKIQHGASPYGDTLKYIKKLIDFILQQENINPQQCEISVLNCIGSENFGREGDVKEGMVLGKSIGVAYSLGLLSAIHQKPINQKIAATGVVSTKTKKAKINDQEINLPAGAVLPIGGIKAKSFAATEKGINRLVLSKYQSSPFLLSEKADPTKEVKAEDYQQVVPTEIIEKIKVNWVESIAGLKQLLLGNKLI